MKNNLIALAALFLMVVSVEVQMNVIIFPKPLSATNSVLMTNAEFRVISGNKIFFRNNAGYKTFRAIDLNTNVLATLHVTASELNAKQAALDQANRNYASQLAVHQNAIAKAKQNPNTIHFLPNGQLFVPRPPTVNSGTSSNSGSSTIKFQIVPPDPAENGNFQGTHIYH